MKYQVLARRYRPRRFEEVVGQESVAETLHGAVLQDRVAHAYLFTGPRGIGKTSMARIFAKALNCPQAADRTREKALWGQPCDDCSTCEAIHTGQDIDVLELDGASHRGIEDVRSIIEGVNRPATRGLFKIYIIDEVHMLTREAFNALLKTLEEPPPHVKFIFATTEPHRIPETVLSRCQRFDFHPIGEEAIVRRLSQILASEGRSGEEGLLERIARYGKGGLRDAQTLLDQLMTFSEGLLRLEELERMTGRMPEARVAELAEAVVRRDTAAVLKNLRESFERGADPAILLEQVIDGFRGRIHALLKGGKEGLKGAAGGLDRLLGFLQILLDASSKIKFSPFAEVSVEVVFLKLARLEDPAVLEDVIRALSEIEDKGSSRHALVPPPVGEERQESAFLTSTEPPQVAPPPERGEAPSSREAPHERATEKEECSLPPDFRHLLSLWDQIGIELDSRHPDTAPYLRDLTPSPLPGNPDTFLLVFGNDFYFRQMKSPRRQDALLEVVREVSKAPWKLQMEQKKNAEGGLGLPGGLPGIPLGGSLKAPASLPQVSPPVEGKGARSLESSRPPAQPSQEGILKTPILKKSLEIFNGRLV